MQHQVASKNRCSTSEPRMEWFIMFVMNILCLLCLFTMFVYHVWLFSLLWLKEAPWNITRICKRQKLVPRILGEVGKHWTPIVQGLWMFMVDILTRWCLSFKKNNYVFNIDHHTVSLILNSNVYGRYMNQFINQLKSMVMKNHGDSSVVEQLHNDL